LNVTADLSGESCVANGQGFLQTLPRQFPSHLEFFRFGMGGGIAGRSNHNGSD
jgi:hypothetical protein